MLQTEIEIINKLGLHARAAAKLVTTASAFESKIEIEKEGRKVDAKSIMSVMMLAASCGSKVTIYTQGEDQEDAMQAITALINDRFGEGE